MNWIIAERSTLLKRRPAQSSTLADSEKQPVAAGIRYDVLEYTQAVGGHWKVTLEDDPTPWYIFDNATAGEADSHWHCSWEDDPSEQETLAAPSVTSNDSKDTPVGKGLTPGMPFSTRITPHITYGEFALYQEARRFHYQHQCETAAVLAEFMEQCRTHFGGDPVVITSGYRPYAVNKAVGGAKMSEHLYRAPLTGAVDFCIKGVSIWTLQEYCLDNWTASVGKGAGRGFVHLGLRGSKHRKLDWIY